MPTLNRRDFLKLSGLTAGAAAADLGLRPARAAGAPVAAEERIPTLCEMCTSRCGVFAIRRNGRIVRIEGNPDHPTNLGRPCTRGNAGVAALYDPDRLQRPLKRGADGKLTPISWAQAFREIGAQLQQIKETEGAQSLVWLEYNNLNSILTRRFVEAYGSPNHTGHAATCFANRNVAYAAVYGGLPTVDYANVKYYLSAGRNLLGGIKVYEVAHLVRAKAKGARIVVLDPRFSELAGWGTDWLPIRPAGDLAFLLAVAHVLIQENLYDQEFVAKATVGFDELKAGLAAYTPEWQVQHTGLGADRVRQVARDLAAARPAAVVDPGWHGGNGMYWNGCEAARAGAIVNALLGNLGARGGLKMAPKVAQGPLDIAPPEADGAVDGGGG